MISKFYLNFRSLQKYNKKTENGSAISHFG